WRNPAQASPDDLWSGFAAVHCPGQAVPFRRLFHAGLPVLAAGPDVYRSCPSDFHALSDPMARLGRAQGAGRSGHAARHHAAVFLSQGRAGRFLVVDDHIQLLGVRTTWIEAARRGSVTSIRRRKQAARLESPADVGCRRRAAVLWIRTTERKIRSTKP